MDRLKTDLVINLDELEKGSDVEQVWWLNQNMSDDVKSQLKLTQADKKFFKECVSISAANKKQKNNQKQQAN